MAIKKSDYDNIYLTSIKEQNKKNYQKSNEEYRKNIQNDNSFFKKSKGGFWSTLGNSALDAGGNLVEGSLNAFEGISDWARYRGADVLDFFGADKKAEKTRKIADENTTASIVSDWNHITAGDLSGTKSEEEIGHFKSVEENSIFGDKTDSVFQGVGNSLTNAAVASYLGAPVSSQSAKNIIGMTTFGVSAAGGAEEEAISSGATRDEARLYGVLSGTVEAGSEMLFGGLGKINQSLGFGKGALDDVIVNNFTKNMKSSLLRNITTLGIKSVGEGLEEVTSGFGNALAQKLTYMKEEDLNKLIKDQKLMDSFVSGMLSSAIMQSPSTIRYTAQGRDINTGLTQSQQKVFDNEIQKRLEVAQQEKGKQKLTNKETMEIQEQVLQDFQNGKIKGNSLVTNGRLPLRTQTTQQAVSLPGIKNSIQETGATQSETPNVFQYENTGNIKIDEMHQSAAQFFNNSEQTHQYLSNVEKVITDKNYAVVFDDKITNPNGRVVNAQIQTDEKTGQTTIKINPNSPRSGEFLLVHEITHGIETETMKKLVIDYASKHSDFNEALESLKKTYGTEDVSSEVVADISGQLFGNQEFISNLSMNEPSLFRKIYNKIIEIANKITGNSNEALFIHDLKNKWEAAYRNQNNNVKNAEYAIANTDYANLTPNQQKRLDRAEELRKEGKTNKDIWSKTGFEYRDNNSYDFYVEDLKFKKTLNVKTGQAYNIEEVLEGELLDTYPFLKNKEIVMEDLIKDAQRDDVTNTEYLKKLKGVQGATTNDGKLVLNTGNLKTTKEATNVLSHEIQHLIQEYQENGSEETVYFGIDENGNYYTKGVSEKEALAAYRNHKNEIEAEVTRVQNAMTKEQRHRYPLSLLISEVSKHYSVMSKSIKSDKFISNLENKYGQLLDEWYDNNGNGVYGQNEIERNTNTNSANTTRNESKSHQRNNIANLPRQGRGSKKFINLYVEHSESNVGENNSESNRNTRTQEELDNSSFSLKQKQLEIVLKENPMLDDYHTGIRTIDDIKTFEEAFFEDGEYSGMDPDFTEEMANKSMETGKITVYSSYPIENGVFVSPSKMEASQYAGGDVKKLYSKEININDVAWIDGAEGQYAKVDTKFSKQNKKWQDYLESNYKSTGTKTDMNNIKLPGLQRAIKQETDKALLPLKKELEKLNKNITKVLNPLEISQLTPQDANTTPNLPGISRNKVGDGKSKFFDNIKDKTNMLNEEQKAAILNDEDVKYYDKITNKDSLDKAFERLQEDGQNESLRWFNKVSENADATDVAEGWILLKQYADSGNTDGMVEVAKKLRDMGTKAGQTVQAFNIMSRLTPEGMVKYAQSELLEAYDQIVKNKSTKWIEENKSKFDLQPNEVQFIMDTMKEVSTMEDGYDKRFKLAEIQKVLTDKLPPQKGAGIKAWMRISMLFNPKTQVRNVVGNALIAPINSFGDLFASGADKLIAKKTGVRTTGTTNFKDYMSGMKKGLYESYNDFKKDVNTRNIQGNRFELTEGRSFNNNTMIGKALNKVDNLLSFMLDAGDRGFYEASFVNSINNQMVLNNTTEVTQDMIDIATQEALSRTWQDNNEYTKFVIGMRNGLNKLMHVGDYGLGDVLIPFAKTPANLTKAIVDYSPVGLVSALNKGIKLNRSLTNEQYSAKTQHEFVQSLGKATAGTMLYVLGYALAKAGITSGASDEDKDVANFLKNTLGKSSYSIKIGDKTFTYDWAQPIAAPFSMMANMVQKQKEGATLAENITTTLDTGLNLLFEQSFLESLSNVLSQPGEIGTKMIDQFLDLPARAVPTLFKQITDLVDGTQRQTYVKDKPIESMINEVKAKIPGLSQTLAPSVDTLGRDIKKYGGKNNIFNVFLNPANVNSENISGSAQEIYRLYKTTGVTDIMPRVAPYYINKNNEKINLTTSQRSEYQKVSGQIIEENIERLLNTKEYKNMSDTQKAEVIQDIVNYSYNIAQKEVLDTELSNTYQKAYEYSQIGNVSDYYTFRNNIDDTNATTKKESIKNYLVNSSLNDEQLAYMYGNYYSSPELLNSLVAAKIPMKEFIKYNSQEFTSDYNSNGEAISNSRKNKVISYINNLNLSIPQKAILIRLEYSSFDNYDKQIVNYINNMNYSQYEKASLLKQFGFDDYDSYLINYVNNMNISKDEKTAILKEMGFTIRNGKVYS